MSSIVPKVSGSVKKKMRKRFQNCRIAAVRVRYLIIFNLWNGRGARLIETILDVHNTTVYRVRAAKKECGRGLASEWIIAHEELVRIQNHGLLPAEDGAAV